MTGKIEESPLYSIANPESIAIFGASNKYTSMGTSILSSILHIGYRGKIYPVHPSEKTVLEYKAYQSVADLPEVPDLAIMVLPTGVVPEVMEACGQKGIKHAIVVSGGFKEVGKDGAGLEAKLKRTAAQYGIRFLGPNCIGAVNTHFRFNATFLPCEHPPGFIGMASQSGSFITQMFAYLGRYGLGFSTGFSVGNEADIDIVDCMEYLAACPDTKVISLYIESIRRGSEFVEAARRIVPQKPIVAYYAGGTEAGRKAGLSHTGALAGEDPVYNGIFRQSGVIRAWSIEELFDICWCLGTCPLPKGNRVIVQTHSGGPGTVAADACERFGMKLPGLSEETKQRLAEYVPHTGSMSNPVDLTFSRRNLDYFVNIPEILKQDENADMLLLYLMMPLRTVRMILETMGVSGDELEAETEKFVNEQSRYLSDMMLGSEKPVIGFSYYSGENPFIKSLYDLGAPVLPGPNRAARAMGAMLEYLEFREKLSPASG
ncbi:MAG: CoA-binding protein [Desulfobacteraceae bacterium]|nr:CoA-binding protein [Desulfobacteraceae bacterium]